MYGGDERISKEKEEKLKELYLKRLNLKMYMLDNNSDMSELFENCINFFQE